MAKKSSVVKVEVLFNNTKIFGAAQNASVNKGLALAAAAGEAKAKELVPVDTGDLKNSIGHEVDKVERKAVVYATKDYAPHVEYGTVHQAAQPYMTPAMEESKRVLKEHIGSKVGDVK